MDDETQTSGTVDTPVTTDTVATPTSEADVQVSNGAPEAAQSQEETTVVNAMDTAEEKLYAGKYKSVEEMEKAYQELNSKFTTTTQEKAELSRILNDAFSTDAQVVQPGAVDGYQDEIDPVNQEIEALKRNQAVTNFVINHQDADAASMQKVLAEDPLVKQISGHEAKLEYAYLRSQNMAKDKAIAEARKQGAQATQAKIAEKQVAQVETASQATIQTDEKAELMEKMQRGSVADREAARRKYIRNYLTKI